MYNMRCIESQGAESSQAHRLMLFLFSDLQLLRALDTLHQGAGMMHGALQPDNVCLAGMFQSATWIGSMDSMRYSLESWGRKLLRQQPLPRPRLPQVSVSV